MVWVLVLFSGCLLLAWLLHARRGKISRQHFESDFLMFLSLMVSELRSGRSLTEALLSAGHSCKKTGLFFIHVRELEEKMRQGLDFKQALLEFGGQLHPDLYLFRSSLLLAYEQGATLSPCLIRLRRFTKLRQAYRRHLKTSLVAQKLSALGIIASTVMVIVMQFLSNQGLLRLLLSNSAGLIVLVLSVGLILVGMLFLVYLCREPE